MSGEGAKPLTARLTSTFAPAENELTRWRRTFDRFAKEDVEGKK
jgi:solute carrier family 25 aspartate/glutamate transporter 12/13